MAALNPYLNFNGNTEEAFNFYKSVFGGEFAMVMRMKDVPADVPMPKESREGDVGEKIMHIALPVGKNNVIMGSDAPDSMPAKHGTGVWISISAESKEEADKLFNGLSAGGNTIMPMGDAFWGSYFGMFKDKYEIYWMISYDKGRQ